MPDKSIRVAIIDNAIAPDVYTPVAHWAEFLTVAWEAFTARDGRLPDLDAEFSHIILTGSEASIIEREPWVESEIEFVKEAARMHIPLLGSCYGHQLLAVALAGPQHVRRCPVPETGWLPIRNLRANPLLGPAGLLHAYTLHFDEVIDLDDDYEVLASSPLCPVHAFKRKGHPFWGIQAHPEINIESGKALLRNLIELDGPHVALFQEALKGAPRDSGAIRRILRHFLSL